MSPRLVEYWASPSAIEHMWFDHGVSLEEAIEAAQSTSTYRPGHPRQLLDGTIERRYVIPGKTGGDRRLWVVVADETAERARILTAWEPVAKHDRALHRRTRGD